MLKAECPDGDRVKVCWVHLYEPQYWEVLETEAVHWNGIICLRLCSGAPQPLLFLDVAASQVTCVDFRILSFHRCIVSLI